jgi:ABC-type multidrug transport system ATPase subunit
MSALAVEAEGLVKTFGFTRALDGIDLQIPQGTALGLLGPNGAGKTTAVRILSTFLRPDAGRAQVAGMDVLTDPHGVRGKIGLSGLYAAVDENLTGFENLYKWNPVTAVADASRELFANTVPTTFPPPGGWPGEHSVLYAVLSSVAIIAVFAPLTVVRYRGVARR